MFITIDGPDGAGKTSLAHILRKKLELHSKVLYTCEPTDSELGKSIRRILKSGSKDEFSTLKDLFILDRQNHINDFIIPKIKDGFTIICDRYKYSTICYQHLQGYPVSQLVELNSHFLTPDIALILYTDNADILLKRIGERAVEKDLFETKSTLEKTLEIYKSMKNYFPDENIIMINVEGALEDIVTETMNQLRCRHKIP